MVGSFRGRFWRKTFGVLAALAWLGVTLAGLKWLLDYQSRPGEPAHPPAIWPAASTLAREPRRATLLLLAHPHCPCTRATLSELERLMAAAGDRLRCEVVFVIPPGRDSTWALTDQWHSAAHIPGVAVVIDRGGVEARRFGAATSGQALLYGADGRLAFSGGITPGRGHAGDSAGRDAILLAAVGGTSTGATLPASASTPLFGRSAAGLTSTPVFGCPLFSEHTRPDPRDSTCSR